MDAFSTGDVARITRSSVQMVIKWLDKGMLKGWRVPGSKFRRVNHSDLRRFMIAHQLPLDLLDRSESFVLLVSDDEALRSAAVSLTVCERKLTCADVFEAGMIFKSLEPCAVIIDCELGGETARKVLRAVQQGNPTTPVVAVSHRDGTGIDPVPCIARAEFSDGLAAILRPLLGRA
jgi:CheY-like chemotaxis protein